jgi:pyruvate formate lyase activating enzyme
LSGDKKNEADIVQVASRTQMPFIANVSMPHDPERVRIIIWKKILLDMRLISLQKKIGNGSLELSGCPLKCRYCGHASFPRIDNSYDKTLQFLSDNLLSKVYIGGAEPMMQKKEVIDLIRVLKRRGKEITLKTTGADPKGLKETIGFVSRYVIEIKGPIDDVALHQRLTQLNEEGIRAYLTALRESLEILKGQKVRIFLRIIPGYVTDESIDRLGRQLQGYADQANLVQFMSSKNDLPFEGISAPGPDINTMIQYGEIVLRYIPYVHLQGNGLDSILKTNRVV